MGNFQSSLKDLLRCFECINEHSMINCFFCISDFTINMMETWENPWETYRTFFLVSRRDQKSFIIIEIFLLRQLFHDGKSNHLQQKKE